jgi:F-type H+-transporting ATPase subunit delta
VFHKLTSVVQYSDKSFEISFTSPARNQVRQFMKRPLDITDSESVMRARMHIGRKAKQLYRLCVVNGLLNEQRVQKVVQYILNAKRRDCLALLGRFCRWVKLDRARHTAEVDSAIPLPADLQADVRKGLQRAYGPGITTSFVGRPELIGGMRIKIGSDVYDGSIKRRLAALEETF